MNDRIWIIVTVFSEWRQLGRCLEALEESIDKDFNVLLVDHGPLSRQKELAKQKYPRVTTIHANASLWWAGATNVGIRRAIDNGASLIMLLNSDCYIAPNTISALRAHHKATGGNAVIAPIQLDADSGRVVWAGSKERLWLGFPTAPDKATRVSPGLSRTKLIGGGRGVLIPVSIFMKVGELDESNFPHYYADHDFYFRCRKFGVPLLVANDTLVLVDAEKTTSASKYGSLSIRGFLKTLTDTRSHRNIRATTALFKRHYPIKGLYIIGVTLNVARYTALFVLKWLLRQVKVFGAASETNKKSS